MIAHIYFSPLSNDSRSYRAAKAGLSSQMGGHVLLLGHGAAGLAASQTLQPGMDVVRLGTSWPRFLPRVLRRTLEWCAWSFAATRALVACRPDLIHCHSLAALIPAVAAKKKLGVPLIYDARELETQRNGWNGAMKSVAGFVESRLIRRADAVLVVSDSIAQWYRREYKLGNVSVIRNVPEKPATPVVRNRRIREDFGIGDDELVFLYLGVIGRGRGWEKIVEAFQALPPDRHMVFVGDGGDAGDVAAIADVVPNIHWREPVPVGEVAHYAAGADVGISLVEDTCLSYRFSLPNKLHEYRIAGLPVIVSDLPEMSRYVAETQSGWTAPDDRDGLLKLIGSIDHRAIKHQLARVTQPPLTWEDEKQHYLDILNPLLQRRPAANG